MELPVELQNQIVDFLKALPNIQESDTQTALLNQAGLDLELQTLISCGKPPAQFFPNLVSILLHYGMLRDGRDALEAVLEASQKYVGIDKKEQCQTLLQTLHTTRKAYNAKKDNKINLIVFSFCVMCAAILGGFVGRMTKPQDTHVISDDFENPTEYRWYKSGSQLFPSSTSIDVVAQVNYDHIKGSATQDNRYAKEFPGTLQEEISSRYSLQGKRSLKFVTSVDGAGSFKTLLYRKAPPKLEGAMAYVFTPSLSDVMIGYVQFCGVTTADEWCCSGGTEIREGEWIPIILDLRKKGKNGELLATHTVDQLALQWRFTTTSRTKVEFYFDSIKFFAPVDSTEE